ncbi:copper homeostasis protein CutC, partial [bacterium]
MIVEIVAQSADDALVASWAGASRVELVSALSLGGLTPSLGTLQEIRVRRCEIPVVTMLRPRSGGFAYSPGEIDTMVR